MKSKALLVASSLAVLLSTTALPALSQSIEHDQIPLKLVVSPPKQADNLVEEYEFQLKNYAFDYQGQKNVLDIDVLYQYVTGITKPQYPDVVAVKKDLEQFMLNYPDKMQYWEILNKDATKMLLAKYPALATVTIKLQIFPNEQESFARTSTVTRSRR
jgi:hypothetical protein